MKSYIKWIVFIGAVFLGGYAGVSPLIAVYQIKTAIQQQNKEALSEYVDFQSLRVSLKEQLDARISERVSGRRAGPFAALAAGIGSSIADGLVDRLVTPEGVTNLMAGRQLPDAMSEKSDVSSAAATVAAAEIFKNARISYEGLNRFLIRMKTERGVMRFVLVRKGFHWKLSDIRLPAN